MNMGPGPRASHTQWGEDMSRALANRIRRCLASTAARGGSQPSPWDGPLDALRSTYTSIEDEDCPPRTSGSHRIRGTGGTGLQNHASLSSEQDGTTRAAVVESEFVFLSVPLPPQPPRYGNPRLGRISLA
ncbi:hypothetical protein PMIN04_008817 [Paraphaeosphaeria minitans]